MSAAALLADIYADPEDDAPRLVYADLLMQAGDPRGDLIACQLARPRGAEPSDRERALLAGLGRNVLGSLAPLLGPGYGHSATRLERGFVAIADVGSAGSGTRRLDAVIDEPAWATVERLVASRWIPRLMARAPLRALREIDRALSAEEVAAIAERREPLVLFERIELHARDLDRIAPAALARVFPRLTRLTVRLPLEGRVDVASLSAIAKCGVRQIAVEQPPGRPGSAQASAIESYRALAEVLVGAPAFVDELAVRSPDRTRCGDGLDLVRSTRGSFATRIASPVHLR